MTAWPRMRRSSEGNPKDGQRILVKMKDGRTSIKVWRDGPCPANKKNIDHEVEGWWPLPDGESIPG